MNPRNSQLDILVEKANERLARGGVEDADLKDIMLVGFHELKQEIRNNGNGKSRTIRGQATDWGVKSLVVAAAVSLLELGREIVRRGGS